MTLRDQPEPVEGYEGFFQLREAPFSLAPDPRFLFAGASHSAALAQVAYAIQRREPLVVVTGEIGTGKTLLCRTVLQRLPGKTFLSVISDPLLGRDDLLKQMLQDFGVISKDRTRLTSPGRHELVQALHAFLSSLSSIQAHAVVIVDEAQHLQPDVLEQIRLLSNVDDARGTALGIILVGQTDLEQLLSRPELRQLQQRVSRSVRLAALNRNEVQQYVEHRLSLAGGPGPGANAVGWSEPGAPSLGSGVTSDDSEPSSELVDTTDFAWDLLESLDAKRRVEFTTDALDALSQLSSGVPRVINLLCDRSLEAACAARLHVIDKPVIDAAAARLGIGQPVVPEAPVLRLAARRPEVKTAEPVEPLMLTQAGPDIDVEITHPVVEAIPLEFSAPSRQTAAPGLMKYAALAIAVAAAAAAILFGVRDGQPAANVQRPASSAASSATRTPSAEPRPATPDTGTLPREAATAAGAPTPPAAAAPTITAEQFEIVVASFRTDARATSVAAEVAALGLPTRRRVSNDWQQVIAGPFASRTDAEDAQQRLGSAGLTGTQIMLAAR